MSKKEKIINWIVRLFIFICIIGLIYSTYNIVIWKLNVNANNKINKEIHENIKTDKDNNIKIDFAKLKELNPDTVAYIQVRNTSIDYVVVKGNDNEYYLNHNFEKKWNVAGWIFGDHNNKFDGTDDNLIIYGHNTNDGSMFGTLNNVLTSEWNNNPDNYIITLITEKGTNYYQVFSTYQILPTTDYLLTGFDNKNKYEEFINKLKNRSEHNYNMNVNKNDKILTLSSCIGRGEKRVVLHAKLINKESK